MRAFRDASEFTLRSPFMKEMGFYSKDARMQLEELPMAIDLYMHLIEKPRMKESKDEEPSQDETNS
jgi:hypothetical protein